MITRPDLRPSYDPKAHVLVEAPVPGTGYPMPTTICRREGCGGRYSVWCQTHGTWQCPTCGGEYL